MNIGVRSSNGGGHHKRISLSCFKAYSGYDLNPLFAAIFDVQCIQSRIQYLLEKPILDTNLQLPSKSTNPEFP